MGTKIKVTAWLLLVCEILWAIAYIIPLMLKKFHHMLEPQPLKKISGKKVLITGAAQGIGKGLAAEFVRLGCKVMCVDVNTQACEQTAQELGENAQAFTCDISDSKAVSALYAKTGPVDILINNAAVIIFGPFLKLDENMISRTVDVNVKAHFWMLREYLPEMLKRNEGQVVGIASAGGLIAPANLTLYSATKYAVVGLMESLTEELRLSGSNVKLTCVCPNFVRTVTAFDTELKARIPPMEVSEAVQGIMKGIIEEQPIFTVPQFLLHPLRVLRVFPMEVEKRLRDVMYIHLGEFETNSSSDSSLYALNK